MNEWFHIQVPPVLQLLTDLFWAQSYNKKEKELTVKQILMNSSRKDRREEQLLLCSVIHYSCLLLSSDIKKTVIQ